jgi:hypothetical protein
LDNSGVRKYLPRDPDTYLQIDHALRAFQSYEQATTTTIIRGAWQKTGFDYRLQNGTSYLWVDEAKIQ